MADFAVHETPFAAYAHAGFSERLPLPGGAQPSPPRAVSGVVKGVPVAAAAAYQQQQQPQHYTPCKSPAVEVPSYWQQHYASGTCASPVGGGIGCACAAAAAAAASCRAGAYGGGGRGTTTTTWMRRHALAIVTVVAAVCALGYTLAPPEQVGGAGVVARVALVAPSGHAVAVGAATLPAATRCHVRHGVGGDSATCVRLSQAGTSTASVTVWRPHGTANDSSGGDVDDDGPMLAPLAAPHAWSMSSGALSASIGRRLSRRMLLLGALPAAAAPAVAVS